MVQMFFDGFAIDDLKSFENFGKLIDWRFKVTCSAHVWADSLTAHQENTS